MCTQIRAVQPARDAKRVASRCGCCLTSNILCKSHVPILFLPFPSLPTSPPYSSLATRVVVDTPRCCLNLGPQARLGIQSLSLVLSLDLPLQRFDVDTAEPPSPTSFLTCLLRLSSLAYFDPRNRCLGLYPPTFSPTSILILLCPIRIVLVIIGKVLLCLTEHAEISHLY